MTDAPPTAETTARSTSPSRSGPRLFWVGMAVLIAVVAVVGFWPTYWGPLFAGTIDVHWLLHLHGVVFMSWVGFLIVQTGLVYRGRTNLHQKAGASVGIGLGVLVVVIGVSTVFGSISPDIGREFEDLQGFISWVLAINLPGIVAFIVLFGAGVAYRRRPAAHKRLMFVATLTLLSAATVRLFMNGFGLSFQMSTLIGRSIPLMIAGLGMVHDLRSRSRVHPAYWVGAAALILDDGFAFVILTDTWTYLTGQIAAWLESVLMPLL